MRGEITPFKYPFTVYVRKATVFFIFGLIVFPKPYLNITYYVVEKTTMEERILKRYLLLFFCKRTCLPLERKDMQV